MEEIGGRGEKRKGTKEGGQEKQGEAEEEEG